MLVHSIRRARWATFAIFFACGLAFSAWASRLPAVRDLLDLTPQQLGRILFVGSLGSICTLPLAGIITSHFGPKLICRLGVIGQAVTLVGAAGAATLGSRWGLIVALVALNIVFSLTDLAMNLHGTAVDKAGGTELMPQFHGGFSLGTVVGAGIGAASSALGVAVWLQMLAVGAVLVVLAVVATHLYLPVPPPTGGPKSRGVQALRAWGEGRTLALGMIVLGAALTEGAANDWIALATVDSFGAANYLGAVAFAIFVSGMTAMRFAGTWLVARFGRVLVIRLCAWASLLGVVGFVSSPWLGLAMVSAVIWGAGAALGFPLGFAAAGEEPVRAAARLAVVSTIGYGAFLAGPPLLGELVHHFGYRWALGVLAFPVALGLLFASAARPRPLEDQLADRETAA
ncbi:hypothetical protein BSZ40_00910 [Buchananella hordeovulneris]|uniref:MFS transporter n=1 Tax=Buchananella hordeovulneris TaxID=52770 RepID=A0A1Q5PYT3_9ACTO|nr:hypothetical protein BSZ40_00910 [Buchananella hordeovulneris]